MRYSNVLAAAMAALAVLVSILSVSSLKRAGAQISPAQGIAQLSALAAPDGSQASVSSTQWAQTTALRLANTNVPGRDLLALTQRLKLHGTPVAPGSLNSQPPNYAVGTRQQFNVADVVKKNTYSIWATVRYVTPHAYWYVKDGYNVDLALLRASADHFESHIYPTNRRIFGPEPSPGIDNDQHITVLLTPLVGLNGYFSMSDAFPRAVNPYSNEREMIYMGNRPEADPGNRENDFEATLAHEFQHMIHWNVHKERDIWLDEGCSEIAMYLNGYDPGSFDTIFGSAPDTQLNSWASQPGQALAHYGAAYLFLRYLMDHYGGESFIAELFKQPGLGIDAIDGAVKKAGNPLGFGGAYKDWLVANLLNNPQVAGGRYAYANGGLARIDRVITSYPATRGDTVHQYGADYIKLSGNVGQATITFRGDSAAKVIAAGPHSGQAFWYSNRRDSGDSTLTRNVDLTRTGKATLQFWTWYDIEYAFDYAYVEASTDGGKTWTALKGKYTTTANPNGQSFGQAWTGKSGVAGDGTGTARWVQESVDLSPYAGKSIQIRFESVTDEGYNAPGLAVDDLRIPEIGYSDNAETDNGWEAQGFVRIGSTIPQKWYVALVENGSRPRVREMAVDSTGYGTLRLVGLGNGAQWQDATLIISPLAPKTTELSSYTVTIKKR